MHYRTVETHCMVCRRRRRLGTPSQQGIIYQCLLLTTEQSPSDLRNHASMYRLYSKETGLENLSTNVETNVEKKQQRAKMLSVSAQSTNHIL